MSPPDGSPRPSQVTVAGWGIAVASLMLVISVFDTMANLKSVDMRDAITKAVTTGSAEGLGLSVADATEILRWSLFVTGVAGVAAVILGIFVLQRNHGARIGLTVAAVPIVLTAPLSGNFLGMFIAAGTTILWTRPARDWFAGRQPERREVPPPMPALPPLPQLPHVPSEQQPPPTVGWGQAPQPGPGLGSEPAPAPWQPPTGPPVAVAPPAPPAPPAGPNPYGYYPPTVRERVPQPRSAQPRQVRVACILTWIFTALTGFVFAGLLVAVAVDSDALLERLQETPGWSSSYDDVAITAMVTLSVVSLVWSLATAVVAVFAWRQQNWAWVLLMLSIGLAALISLFAIPASLVHLAALAVSLGMLLSRPSRDWFNGR